MGRCYNNNPRVAFLQLGLLGFWVSGTLGLARPFTPSPPPSAVLSNTFHRAFPGKMLMARYARDHAASQSWLGFHDDMFPEDTDNGKALVVPEPPQRHGTPIRTGNTPRSRARWSPTRPNNVSARTSTTHCVSPIEATFHGSGPIARPWRETRRPNSGKRHTHSSDGWATSSASPKFGTLPKFPQAQSLRIKIVGLNEGVAPFYYLWPGELALLSDAGKLAAHHIPLRCDIRTWQPGPFELESDVALDAPAGRYKLALGVIDPWTSQPAIRFANNLTTQDGWTVLSTVSVGQSP